MSGTLDRDGTGVAVRPRRLAAPRSLPLPTARLLNRGEAAAYLGLGPAAPLPVAPKRVRPGKQGLRYDLRDLDRWIDSLEAGPETETDAQLLDRLIDDKGARSRR
ncbi:hypothetical protein [Methylobacterium oryzihabitans]|uniref:Uncharacterized protein n=1 Tax=Methylobacterium oryzihabitans TaxID=2499852 RepID=A0A437P5C3_9HYPH|nr:hypothetical protein [Methylobacterium oryzihabitans]RVU17466.1 hypothetical protein EOE48_13845 [Methylobacterium oryzihabitans]